MLTLQILKDELQERQVEQQLLETSTDRHLFGDDHQIVEERERIVGILSHWQELHEKVEEFPGKMLPWQQMVDLQYNLKSWLEEVMQKLAKTEQRLREIERDKDDPMEVLPIFKVRKRCINLTKVTSVSNCTNFCMEKLYLLTPTLH